MIQSEKTVVGKRGEILAKKSLRDAAGIRPGDDIFIEATSGQFFIRKIPTISEILQRPPIARVTAQQLEKELDEEDRKQEEKAN